MVDSDNNSNRVVPYNPANLADKSEYKNIDLFSIKNAYQAMVIKKLWKLMN